MKRVCVAARMGEGKASGVVNSHSIAKTSNAAIADSGCNPSGWHEFWQRIARFIAFGTLEIDAR